MLSQDDRRRLEAIEHQLRADDPDLADRLAHWPAPARERWSMTAAVMTIVLGALGLLLGIASLSLAFMFLSSCVMAAGWTWVPPKPS
jgi:CHASE2 domain-containing sensor protein